jgi:predicted HD phosphohydrolase
MDSGGIVNNPPSQKAYPPEEAMPSSGTTVLPGELTGSESEPEGPVIVESVEPPPSRPASLNYIWRYTETSNFVSAVIKPYWNLLGTWDALEGIHRIIAFLDAEGGCPSLVTVDMAKLMDSHEKNYLSIGQYLRKVTVREHSFRVAQYAIEELRKAYRDYQNLLSPMIVAALGHDLGKITSLRTGDGYVKSNHPILSKKKVELLFEGIRTQVNERWLEHALDLIYNHHTTKTDQAISVLREADSRARASEVAAKSGCSVKMWEEWFDPKEYLTFVRPYINVTQTGDHMIAFSHQGVVYCDRATLYETAQKYARSKKIIDMSLVGNGGTEAVMAKIVKQLREVGAICSELVAGESQMLYEFTPPGGCRPQKKYFTPLKVEAFAMPSELEKTKEGRFYSIKIRAL